MNTCEKCKLMAPTRLGKKVVRGLFLLGVTIFLALWARASLISRDSIMAISIPLASAMALVTAWLWQNTIGGDTVFEFWNGDVYHKHQECPTLDESSGDWIIMTRQRGLMSRGRIFRWVFSPSAMKLWKENHPHWRLYSRPLRLVDNIGGSVSPVMYDECDGVRFDEARWTPKDYLQFPSVQLIFVRAQLLNELVGGVQEAIKIARGQTGRTESKAAKEVREYLEKLLASRSWFQQ